MRKLLLVFGVMLAFMACGAGDDDGRRLADLIPGTWLRGWDDGDVIIESDSASYNPNSFSYDRFVFSDDGDYNGMVKNGSCVALSITNDTIFAGTYRCDNNNLRMEFDDPDSGHQILLGQVLSFSETQLLLKFKSMVSGGQITVTVTLRKETGNAEGEEAF